MIDNDNYLSDLDNKINERIKYAKKRKDGIKLIKSIVNRLHSNSKKLEREMGSWQDNFNQLANTYDTEPKLLGAENDKGEEKWEEIREAMLNDIKLILTFIEGLESTFNKTK